MGIRLYHHEDAKIPKHLSRGRYTKHQVHPVLL